MQQNKPGQIVGHLLSAMTLLAVSPEKEKNKVCFIDQASPYHEEDVS